MLLTSCTDLDALRNRASDHGLSKADASADAAAGSGGNGSGGGDGSGGSGGTTSGTGGHGSGGMDVVGSGGIGASGSGGKDSNAGDGGSVTDGGSGGMGSQPPPCTKHTYYADEDGDGYGDDHSEMMACEKPDGYVDVGGDCDDACKTCNKDGTEVCDGAKDENCNNTVDEGCACPTGTSRDCGSNVGECKYGKQDCASGVWGDCVGGTGPVTEICANSKDDDCDGKTDESPQTHSDCSACGQSCAGSLACNSGACAQPALSLSSGSAVTCAQTAAPDGNGAYPVSCWGSNSRNQLRTSGDSRPTPGALNLNPVRDIAVGGDFMCALDDASDGITCWGDNSLHQLADSDINSTENTFTVSGAVAITAGSDEGCAMTASGKVYCWGNNFNERSSDKAYPTREVVLSGTAAEIVGGGVFTCARLTNGQVQCWGLAYNDNGYTVHTVVDASNATLTGAVQVVASGQAGAINGHGCARKSNGEIWCWGFGYYGEIGNGATGSFSFYAATKVSSISNAIDVSVGLSHTCALVSNGTLSCWGVPKYALGNGDTTAGNSTPTTVLTDAIDIESGWSHNCARRRSGQVSCWGYNGSGELGDGTTSERTTVRNVVGMP